MRELTSPQSDLSKGPSIKDVLQFLTILTPHPPNVTFCPIWLDSPPPKTFFPRPL